MQERLSVYDGSEMNEVVAFPTFSVTIVPCLRDNYAYLLTAPGSALPVPGDAAIVIDAGEAAPVNAALAGPVRSRPPANLLTTASRETAGPLPQGPVRSRPPAKLLGAASRETVGPLPQARERNGAAARQTTSSSPPTRRRSPGRRSLSGSGLQ